MGKESFILYTDQIDALKTLPDEEFGAMMKAVYNYAATGETPCGLFPAAEMAFRFIAMQIDRERAM